jgi:hypothetical protein
MLSDLPNDTVSKKKQMYPISDGLFQYLNKYERITPIPIVYHDLLRYDNYVPVYDADGKDTLWESVIYAPLDLEELNEVLTKIYAILKTNGEMSVMDHLRVDRIDYCPFGNSKPFRVKIINKLNDNYDYFYVKQPDASRVYGLELEDLLSPNRINYLVDRGTLIEEHIAGIPGDQFVEKYINTKGVNEIRLAKEFIKFNERCFVRLLGDMRSYNFVIDVTPDFDIEQYRIRAIDFDQQSYEGRRTIYLPQYFKENNPYVDFCMKHLNEKTVRQYQREERTLIGRRLKLSRYRIKELIDIMSDDVISTSEKIEQIKLELNTYYKTIRFTKCRSMGEIVKLNLKLSLTRQD